MERKLALTYDDIQLIPAMSFVEHRQDISLRTKLSRNYEIETPLVASPMDTVCEYEMAYKMYQLGGVGCIHRFMTIEEQVKQVKQLISKIKVDLANKIDDFDIIKKEFGKIPIMAAIGSNGDFLERAIALSDVGANVLIIDVAHGHHINVKRAIEAIKASNINVDIIAGNIATAQAAIDLQDWGADGLRVGIGGGCFTPAMKVKTSEGYVSIIDVKIGDKVYSHNGNLNEVVNKFEFDRDEEIIIINNIECTKNHEFYVVNKKYNSIIDDSNISEYAEWIPAENLTDDYFLVEI
jgi:IMP dehydrogenase/GMP reductase